MHPIFRLARHYILLRVVGFQRRRGADHTTPFTKAFSKAQCESVETAFRNRRHFETAAVAAAKRGAIVMGGSYQYVPAITGQNASAVGNKTHFGGEPAIRPKDRRAGTNVKAVDPQVVQTTERPRENVPNMKMPPRQLLPVVDVC